MATLAKALFLGCFAALSLASLAHANARPCPRFEIAIADERSERTVLDEDGGIVHVERPALLSTADFTGANVTLTEGQIVLNIDLTPEAGGRIQAYSREHVGVRLAFILDGRALKVVRVLDPIRGNGILMGAFTRERADALAALINDKAGDCGSP